MHDNIMESICKIESEYSSQSVNGIINDRTVTVLDLY